MIFVFFYNEFLGKFNKLMITEFMCSMHFYSLCLVSENQKIKNLTSSASILHQMAKADCKIEKLKTACSI